MTYHYQLSNQHASSAKYGKCEVCGHEVDNVYSQHERKDFIDENGSPALTAYECNTYFGHKDCLESMQR